MTVQTGISLTTPSQIDLAGYCHSTPIYWQMRARINYLVERYLSLDILSERLLDLPRQFVQPQQRHWQPIHWQAIHPSQIIGVDSSLFLLVIAAAVEIETPIRAYSQESWSYLEKYHPQLARFMGGVCDETGKIIEVGLWEKEERQHAPAFGKIYQQLTGEKLQPKPNSVKGYQSTGNPRAEIYRHALSRMTTEWSAVSMYLWLMAHSTGALQNAIAQPLQDEVNHLAKFWGIARWAFGNSSWHSLMGSINQLIELSQHQQKERTSSPDLFSINSFGYSVEIGFTFSRVMAQMCRWNCHLKSDALNQVFGLPQ